MELRTFPRSSQRFHSKFVRRGYRSLDRNIVRLSGKKERKKRSRSRELCSLFRHIVIVSSDVRASRRIFVPRPWTSIATDPYHQRGYRSRDT